MHTKNMSLQVHFEDIKPIGKKYSTNATDGERQYHYL